MNLLRHRYSTRRSPEHRHSAKTFPSKSLSLSASYSKPTLQQRTHSSLQQQYTERHQQQQPLQCKPTSLRRESNLDHTHSRAHVTQSFFSDLPTTNNDSTLFDGSESSFQLLNTPHYQNQVTPQHASSFSKFNNTLPSLSSNDHPKLATTIIERHRSLINEYESITKQCLEEGLQHFEAMQHQTWNDLVALQYLFDQLQLQLPDGSNDVNDLNNINLDKLSNKSIYNPSPSTPVNLYQQFVSLLPQTESMKFPNQIFTFNITTSVLNQHKIISSRRELASIYLSIIKNHFPHACGEIYGSIATGLATPMSDCDISLGIGPLSSLNTPEMITCPHRLSSQLDKVPSLNCEQANFSRFEMERQIGLDSFTIQHLKHDIDRALSYFSNTNKNNSSSQSNQNPQLHIINDPTMNESTESIMNESTESDSNPIPNSKKHPLNPKEESKQPNQHFESTDSQSTWCGENKLFSPSDLLPINQLYKPINSNLPAALWQLQSIIQDTLHYKYQDEIDSSIVFKDSYRIYDRFSNGFVQQDDSQYSSRRPHLLELFKNPKDNHCESLTYLHQLTKIQKHILRRHQIFAYHAFNKRSSSYLTIPPSHVHYYPNHPANPINHQQQQQDGVEQRLQLTTIFPPLLTCSASTRYQQAKRTRSFLYNSLPNNIEGVLIPKPLPLSPYRFYKLSSTHLKNNVNDHSPPIKLSIPPPFYGDPREAEPLRHQYICKLQIQLRSILENAGCDLNGTLEPDRMRLPLIKLTYPRLSSSISTQNSSSLGQHQPTKSKHHILHRYLYILKDFQTSIYHTWFQRYQQLIGSQTGLHTLHFYKSLHFKQQHHHYNPHNPPFFTLSGFELFPLSTTLPPSKPSTITPQPLQIVTNSSTSNINNTNHVTDDPISPRLNPFSSTIPTSPLINVAQANDMVSIQSHHHSSKAFLHAPSISTQSNYDSTLIHPNNIYSPIIPVDDKTIGQESCNHHQQLQTRVEQLASSLYSLPSTSPAIPHQSLWLAIKYVTYCILIKEYGILPSSASALVGLSDQKQIESIQHWLNSTTTTSQDEYKINTNYRTLLQNDPILALQLPIIPLPNSINQNTPIPNLSINNTNDQHQNQLSPSNHQYLFPLNPNQANITTTQPFTSLVDVISIPNSINTIPKILAHQLSNQLSNHLYQYNQLDNTSSTPPLSTNTLSSDDLALPKYIREEQLEDELVVNIKDTINITLNQLSPYTYDPNQSFDNAIETDITFQNIGPLNSSLLREYLLIDPRVQPLILMVKEWTKSVQLHGASSSKISSYGYTLITLFYLQQVGILPSLQRYFTVAEKYSRQLANSNSTLEQQGSPQHHKTASINDNTTISTPSTDNTMNDPMFITPSTINSNSVQWLFQNNYNGYALSKDFIGYGLRTEELRKLTLLDLFRGFLDYYSKFDFTSNVISVRTGSVLPKEYKNVHHWPLLHELRLNRVDYNNDIRTQHQKANLPKNGHHTKQDPSSSPMTDFQNRLLYELDHGLYQPESYNFEKLWTNELSSSHQNDHHNGLPKINVEFVQSLAFLKTSVIQNDPYDDWSLIGLDITSNLSSSPFSKPPTMSLLQLSHSHFDLWMSNLLANNHHTWQQSSLLKNEFVFRFGTSLSYHTLDKIRHNLPNTYSILSSPQKASYYGKNGILQRGIYNFLNYAHFRQGKPVNMFLTRLRATTLLNGMHEKEQNQQFSHYHSHNSKHFIISPSQLEYNVPPNPWSYLSIEDPVDLSHDLSRPSFSFFAPLFTSQCYHAHQWFSHPQITSRFQQLRHDVNLCHQQFATISDQLKLNQMALETQFNKKLTDLVQNSTGLNGKIDTDQLSKDIKDLYNSELHQSILDSGYLSHIDSPSSTNNNSNDVSFTSTVDIKDNTFDSLSMQPIPSVQKALLAIMNKYPQLNELPNDNPTFNTFHRGRLGTSFYSPTRSSQEPIITPSSQISKPSISRIISNTGPDINNKVNTNPNTSTNINLNPQIHTSQSSHFSKFFPHLATTLQQLEKTSSSSHTSQPGLPIPPGDATIKSTKRKTSSKPKQEKTDDIIHDNNNNNKHFPRDDVKQADNIHQNNLETDLTTKTHLHLRQQLKIIEKRTEKINTALQSRQSLFNIDKIPPSSIKYIPATPLQSRDPIRINTTFNALENSLRRNVKPIDPISQSNQPDHHISSHHRGSSGKKNSTNNHLTQHRESVLSQFVQQLLQVDPVGSAPKVLNIPIKQDPLNQRKKRRR